MPIKDKKTKSVTTPLLDKVNNPNDLKFLKFELGLIIIIEKNTNKILLNINTIYTKNYGR